MELLKNNQEKDRAISELGIMVDRLSRDAKLMSFFDSNEITKEEKKEYIEKKFSKIYTTSAVINFLKLLVANNRHSDLKEIYQCLRNN